MRKLNVKLGLRLFLSGKEIYYKDDDPFVQAYLYWLWGFYTYTSGAVMVTDTGNNSRQHYVYNPMRIDAPNGNISYGPVIGSGQGAVSLTDYKLGAQITHGVGSGQMTYGTTSVGPLLSPNTSTRMIPIDRAFSNVSGANITVYEVGLYAYDTQYYFCLARDLISGGIEVPNGDVLAVQYQFSVTV